MGILKQGKQGLKVQLRAGDKPSEVLALLDLGHSKYCFLVDRDATYITELNFLKELSQKAKENKQTLHFVSDKAFFRQILKHQKLACSAHIPKAFIPLERKKIFDLTGRLEATKNKISVNTDQIASETDTKTKTKNTAPKPKFQTKKIENTSEERSLRGIIFFIFLCILLFLGLIFTLITPQANITVKPRINSIATTQNVIIALSEATIPFDNQSLPRVGAVFMQTDVQSTETFPSTRETYEVTNAQGNVTLFNTTSEDKYIVPSRLMNQSGLIFRTQSDIIIPGGTEDVPGSIVVPVVADSFDENGNPIGRLGNIEAGTDLYFPGFRPELRQLYYAKADQGPLVGGSTLTNYFVDEDDPEKARPILKESLSIRGTEALKTELEKRSAREGQKFILLEDPKVFLTELTDFQFDSTQVGLQKQTFEVSGKLRVSGLVFDQTVIVQQLTEQLQLNLDDRKKILEIDPTTVNYRIVEHEFLEDQGWIKVSASIEGVETLNFDADNEFARNWQGEIKRDIAGKSLDQARAILLNRPEIENVLSTEISPFWIQQIPRLFDQITLQINY